MFKIFRSVITLRLILLMALMLLVLFNINTVRVVKDHLILTFLGAEIISFIKLWVEMPVAAFFLVIYIKIINYCRFETIFQFIVMGFIAFFISFIVIILPCPETFFLDTSITKKLIYNYPSLKFFILMCAKWIFVLFYVICSIWPTIVYSLFFWQLINKINNLQDSVTIYPIMNFIGQLSLLISGIMLTFFSNPDNFFLKFLMDKKWYNQFTLIYSLSGLVTLTGFLILLTLHFVKYTDCCVSKVFFQKQGKINIGIKESIKIILSSRILSYIFILVSSYSVTVNLMEGIWLAKIKEVYVEPEQYIHYQGQVVFWTGIFTLICTVMSGFLLKHKGWKYSALITPMISLFAGGLFFFVDLL